MLEWPLGNWNDVIFSDECRFGLKNDSGVLRVWRTSNEANNPEFFQPTFTNSVSVMVWGCVGPNDVGKLAFCQRSMNAKYYTEVLEENLLQSAEIIYGDAGTPLYSNRTMLLAILKTFYQKILRGEGHLGLALACTKSRPQHH